MSEKGDAGVLGTEKVKACIHTCCNCKAEILLLPNLVVEDISLSNLPIISQACLFCPFQHFCPEMKRLKNTFELEKSDKLKTILDYLDTQKPFSKLFSALYSGNTEAHFEIKSALSNGVWVDKTLNADTTILSKDQKSTSDGK